MADRGNESREFWNREKSPNRPVQDTRQSLRDWVSIARMKILKSEEPSFIFWNNGNQRQGQCSLKIYGGSETKKLAQFLPNQAPVVDDKKYRKLKLKLDNIILVNSINQPLRNCGQNKMENIIFTLINSNSSLNATQQLCLFFGNCNFYNRFVIGLCVVQFCM